MHKPQAICNLGFIFEEKVAFWNYESLVITFYHHQYHSYQNASHQNSAKTYPRPQSFVEVSKKAPHGALTSMSEQTSLIVHESMRTIPLLTFMFL